MMMHPTYLKSYRKGNSHRKKSGMANHLLDDTIMSFLVLSVQFIILPLDWLLKLTFIEICNKYTDQLMRIAIAISNQHLFNIGFLWLVAKIDIHRSTYLHQILRLVDAQRNHGSEVVLMKRWDTNMTTIQCKAMQ